MSRRACGGNSRGCWPSGRGDTAPPAAIRSSNRSGCIWRRQSRMPWPSNWNTPPASPLVQHLVGLRVVQRQPFQIDRDAQPLQEILRAPQDGQRGQAEEVEFHQSRLFDVLHRILRDQEIGFRIAIQRHQFHQRAVADDHAGGVGGGVAIQAFHLQRDFHQAADAFVLGRAGPAAAVRHRPPAATSPAWRDCWGSVRRRG